MALVVVFLLIVGMNMRDTFVAERQLFPDVAALPPVALFVILAMLLAVHLGICAIIGAGMLLALRTYTPVRASMADMFVVVGYAHVPLVVWALFSRYEVVKFRRLIDAAMTEAIAPEMLLSALQEVQRWRMPAYALAVLAIPIVLRVYFALPMRDTVRAGIIVPLSVGALVWASGLL